MEQLNKQRENPEMTDVVFRFPNEADLPEINAYSMILKSKSPYFEGLLNFG